MQSESQSKHFLKRQSEQTSSSVYGLTCQTISHWALCRWSGGESASTGINKPGKKNTPTPSYKDCFKIVKMWVELLLASSFTSLFQHESSETSVKLPLALCPDCYRLCWRENFDSVYHVIPAKSDQKQQWLLCKNNSRKQRTNVKGFKKKKTT